MLTISMADFTKMQADIAEARQEAATAREEILKLRFSDPSGTVAKVTEFARECLTVVRFGVANLPPEMIRSWPYEALRRICETISVLPDYSVNDRDMALDMLGFVRDCEYHEIRRKGEPPPRRLTPEEIAAERARLEQDPIGRLALGLASKRAE